MVDLAIESDVGLQPMRNPQSDLLFLPIEPGGNIVQILLAAAICGIADREGCGGRRMIR